MAQKSPIQVVLEQGQDYAWCACGYSTTQPFCDGGHKTHGLAPVVFTAEKSGEHWLCGCKMSGSSPFCDGAHKALQPGA
jgi:CDGSH-type Zn-finger protein